MLVLALHCNLCSKDLLSRKQSLIFFFNGMGEAKISLSNKDDKIFFSFSWNGKTQKTSLPNKDNKIFIFSWDRRLKKDILAQHRYHLCAGPEL